MSSELLDEVCRYLSSKPADEWTDLGEIGRVFREYGLTEDETDTALNFLKKHCLELDESGSRARLIRCFYNLF